MRSVGIHAMTFNLENVSVLCTHVCHVLITCQVRSDVIDEWLAWGPEHYYVCLSARRIIQNHLVAVGNLKLRITFPEHRNFE